MSKRRFEDILRELHQETHQDGYYGRANDLEQIVDELVDEVQYMGGNLLTWPITKFETNARTAIFPNCALAARPDKDGRGE